MNDHGGQVIDYALRVKRAEESNSPVRFAGRCLSSCTLYLSLPRDQTCITPGASFGFHMPYGASPRGNRMARSFMLDNYPGWVRDWLTARGGLNVEMKVMDYSYARRFLRPCPRTA